MQRSFRMGLPRGSRTVRSSRLQATILTDFPVRAVDAKRLRSPISSREAARDQTYSRILDRVRVAYGMVGHGGLEPHSYAVPRISLRCTDYRPSQTARLLGVAADFSPGRRFLIIAGGSGPFGGPPWTRTAYLRGSQGPGAVAGSGGWPPLWPELSAEFETGLPAGRPDGRPLDWAPIVSALAGNSS